MFKRKNGLFRLSKLPLLFLVALIFATSLTFGQNIFYHILGLSQGATVAFQSASQSVNESTGTWGDWPSSLNNWNKRRRIVLDGFGTALTDFPVMIKLDGTRISYASTQSAGQDLRFTDNAGNLLSFEIETYNTAGTSVVWVKVPSLAALPSQTSIWMYYDNGGAADGQARTTVWDSNFSGVWHLNSNSTDSTSNAKNGTDTSVTYASGLASNAVSINGTTGNRITLPTGMTSSNVFTFTAFFKTSTSGVILGHTETAYPGATYQFDPLMYVGLDGMLYGGNYFPGQLSTTSYVADNNWHQVVITGNSTIQKIYVDGQYVTSTSGAALNMAALTNTYIGMGEWTSWPNAGTGWSSFNGQIDEVSIATAARSDDWVKASYSSVMDALATYQPEETQASGQGAITFTLSSAQGSSVSVPYTLSGTATNGADYALSAGSVVFNPGVTSVSLTPRILRDQSVESSETLIVTLGTPPVGVTVGSPNPHTVTILDETNVAPVANTDGYTITNLTVPMLLNVLANDTDANNDPLIITSFTAAARGTVLRQGNKLSYLPSEDFAATDSFTYTISDGRGGTATATVNLTLAIPFTWTGATNTSWSTGTNWLGGVAPGVSNTAYFNNQCSTNCNPVIAADISIGGLRINSSYIGTIAQPAGLTITIGNTGWVQRGGTFTGGNSAITIGVQATAAGTPKGSGLNVSGGTFTATSNTLTVNQGDWTLAAGMTFNHNNGTVKFGCGYELWCIIQSGGKTHNHVRFEGYRSSFSGYGSSLTINGNLSLGGLVAGDNRIGDLTMNVSGNVTAINQGYSGGRVRLVGNASGQTVTGAAGIYIPSLEIAAGSNPVTLIGDLGINGGYLGSYVYTSSGAFIAPTTLRLFNVSTVTPGPVSYNNVTISGNGTAVNLGGSTFTITGTLTLDEASYSNTPINNGTINLSGNYVASTQGYVGTAVVNLIGATNTTWNQSGAAQWIAGLTTVNKSAKTNTVTLSTAVNLSSTSQALSVTQGTVDMSGFNLTVNGALTVGANGKIICNGGTLTAGSTSVSGEVSCGPSIGITWTGLAGDGKWTTAGNWTNNNVPGVNDIALFSSICSSIAGGSCNATIDASISVRGIQLMTGYTGTLTQGATSTITLGAGGYTQAAGTFAGSSASMTTGSFGLAAGNFNLSGGTFTATSGTLTNWYNWTISGGTFNHNSGTVVFEGSNIGSTLSTTAVNYNNVTFRGSGTGHVLSGTTMTVLGVLTLGSNYNGSDSVGNGTINARGNVVFDQYGKQSNFASPANLTLRINGSSNQTITSSIGAWAPKLEIASTGGTVTFTGDFIFSADYIWTSGTVNATAASFIFDGKNQSWTTKFDSSNYNNIEYKGSASTYTLSSSTLNVTGTLTLNNVFSSSGNLNSGTINVKGNLAATNYGYLGSAVIKVNGSTNQTISGVSGAWIPGFEIASTGGVVTLSGTVSVRGAYTYTSGVVDAGTSTLHFYANFTTHAVTPGAINYNNVKVGGDGSTFTLTGTLNVQGTFEIAREGYYKPTLNTGTVLAYGNIYFSGGQNYYADYYILGGTHLLKVMGSANQSVSSASGYTGQGWFGGNFEVAKTGGTLTFTGTQDWLFSKNFTHTSGNVDFGTSQANFNSSNNNFTVTPGSINFNNVWIEIYPTTTLTVSGTWQISGQLTLNGYGGTAATLINGGSINLSGNLLSRYAGFGGTTQLNLIGSTNTDFTYGSKVIGSTIVVNKTGGASVRWLSDAIMTSGQNLTVTSGTLDLNGYDLQTDATLTVASGASVVCNNGALSVTTITNSGTISCPGFTGWTHNWTGAGPNALWSNAANWSGGVVPGPTHVAAFNSNLCGANCNPTIDTTVNVLGLQMKNNYSGTITANAGVAITIGARGWKQDAGTFNGSTGTIITNGHLRVWGGTFQASSGETRVVGGGITLASGSTFTHNSGTFRHDTNSTGWATTTLSLGSKNFNNLQVTGTATTFIADSANVAGTLTVNKSTWGGAITGGTLNLSGDVNVTTCECGDYSQAAALFNFTGSGNQTLTVTTGSNNNLPRVSINKSGGTLAWASNFKVVSLVHTAGTVSVPANHTLTIISQNGWAGNVPMTPGTIPFQNLTFATSGTIVTTGSWNVAKNLSISHSTFSASFSGGTFRVSGDLTISSLEGAGTAAVLLEGASDQTVTTASANARLGGTWTINKPAGTVTLASNLSLGNAGQDLMITAGTLNMAGYNLSVSDNITNNGTLRRGTNPTCGTVTSATYTGTAAICP